MITLLMAFFMVMFALSQVDAQKFKQLAVSLGDAFNSPGTNLIKMGMGEDGRIAILPKVSRPSKQPETDPEGTTLTRPKYRDIQELKEQFQKLVKESGLEGTVSVSTNAKGDKLTVRLSDSLLFGVGDAQLSEAAQRLMDNVGAIIAKADKPVRIEGHTDNIPIRSGRYDSNWQLSTDRAVNVLLYLESRYGIAPQNLSAGGYGETRPVETNDTPEGKARNRRVEFVILDGDE